MLKKILIALAIIVALFVILPSLTFFLSPGMGGALFEGLMDKITGTQTVGDVTVNRRESRIAIAQLETAPGKPDALSPVIGQAYEVKSLKKENQPVRVEFKYDPSQLPEGISAENLGLFKWVDDGENKFWRPVASRVDTEKQAVIAELDSFSILAVRAPLAFYMTSEEIGSLNSELASLIEEMPDYTCGLFILVDEELLEWSGGDIMEAYMRPEEEQTEYHDCAANPESGVPIESFATIIEREHNETRVQYSIYAIVAWQADEEDSAVLNGFIQDQDGRALPGVKVIAQKIKYSSESGDTATEEDGNFKLELPSGIYRLTVNPKGSNDKYKNCSEEELEIKMHAFGDLADKFERNQAVAKQGPWNEDFTLQCSDYYIDNLSEVPFDQYVVYAQMTGVEKHSLSGQLVQPIRGGYGWEGEWEVTDDIHSDFKVGDYHVTIPGLPGFVDFSQPDSGGQWEDLLYYTFTLKPGMKPGDTFPAHFRRPENAYKDKVTIGAGTTEFSGSGNFSLRMNHGELSGEETAGAIEGDAVGKIVEIYGEEGALIDINIGYYETLTSAPRAQIKKMGNE
ncbi:carboxypeptidase regulatory-like domain-containing protein [Patescibacteria group bacterium]|nr:carboxypeptidase regulatory-like domain-containing protein [Patescibacteria group bacterium]MBU1922432.1 carboxypeptidase regulatory-like domain-containing protein [Patescibacteria group bacterium]